MIQLENPKESQPGQKPLKRFMGKKTKVGHREKGTP